MPARRPPPCAPSTARPSRSSPPAAARGAIAPRRILAGVLAPRAIWARFDSCLKAALTRLSPAESLDLGCVLDQGAFERTPHGLRLSTPGESLIFFVLRFLDRLREMGTAPAADLMAYGRSLESFQK